MVKNDNKLKQKRVLNEDITLVKNIGILLVLSFIIGFISL